MVRKVALGKGLRALIPDIPAEESDRASSVRSIEVASVSPNPFQPRERFDPETLKELRLSIAENGVVQPITVRPHNSGYQLIAGERRLRAVRDLGLRTIPAYVMDVHSDEEMLELSIIENIHREDLNPLDIGRGYQRLIDDCRLTQEQVAEKVGKDRSTVANFLRLLRLPRRIQESLMSGELSMGHARPLIALASSEEQIRIWKLIVKQGISVRRVEQLVRESTRRVEKSKSSSRSAELSPAFREAENTLRHTLATQVRIKPRGKGGSIEIEYYSLDDLDRIMSMMCSK